MILVIINWLTKMIHYKPILGEVTINILDPTEVILDVVVRSKFFKLY